MTALLDLQIVSTDSNLPNAEDFQLWTDTVLAELKLSDKELTIRVVDEDEIRQLNHQYRGKDKPTNVLSFPFEMPELFFPAEDILEQELSTELDSAELNAEHSELQSVPNLLGDLIICSQVVAAEAIQQSKPNLHHWAHMIVHGTLHLLGYDHIVDDEAQVMESLEITILAKLAIDDPYQDH